MSTTPPSDRQFSDESFSDPNCTCPGDDFDTFCPLHGRRRDPEHERTNAMLTKLTETLREKRDRDPIAWEFRMLCKQIERSQEKMETAWVRAMSAIEHAANAWEAKANDQ